MNDYISNAFTKEGDNTNLKVDNLNVSCITSKENKFELDSNGNLTVNSLTVQEEVSIASKFMLEFVYPIGSIYLSVDSRNPEDFFGGEWEQIKDVFLLSCGDKYANGESGGEETHQLTIAEMPNHNHGINVNSPFSSQSYTGGGEPRWNLMSWTEARLWTNNTGSSQPHNNMPPYLTVSMWKRIK